MITSLQPKFTNYFVQQKESLINNLFITTEAIFMAKTPNLNKAKDYVGGILNNQLSTKATSNYTRLIRFFDEASLDHENLTRSLLLIVFCILKQKKNKKPLYLILDGTSWELGGTKIHPFRGWCPHQSTIYGNKIAPISGFSYFLPTGAKKSVFIAEAWFTNKNIFNELTHFMERF